MKDKKPINRIPCLLCLLYLFIPNSFAENKSYHAEINQDGVQVIKITAGNYFFKPKHIVVKLNIPVELQINKESGLVPHDITMDESTAGMKFSETLNTEVNTILFTPTRAGRFSFYCDGQLLFFQSHRDKGMEGTILVVE